MVKIVSNVDPNSLLQSNGASPIKPSGIVAAADTVTTGIWNAGSVTSSSFITAVGNLRGLALGINTAPQANAGTIQLLPTANGVDIIVANRATDTSPTGGFLSFTNTANNASLFKLDVTGTITVGIWNGTKIATAYGGTNQDTSGWSGVPTINSGTWTQNNVLTTNRLLIAAASNTITSNANLTYDGSTLNIVGSAGPGSALLQADNTATNTVFFAWRNTAANGIGNNIVITHSFKNSTNAIKQFAQEIVDTLVVTAGSEQSRHIWQNGSSEIMNTRMILITGLQLGAPTGGDKGNGSLNVAADVYKNNTAYTNPDYVFHEYYRV